MNKKEDPKKYMKLKLKECKDAYFFFSGKASDNARHLSFAGIGIIWIFRIGQGIKISFPGGLKTAFIFFSISLLLDILHYCAGTIIWGTFHRSYEKKENYDEKNIIYALKYLSWPINFFLATKLISVACGYIFILIFLFEYKIL